MAENDTTVDTAPQLSLGRRVLVYFGLAGDPRVAAGPLELQHPGHGAIAWIAYPLAFIAEFAVALRLRGFDWHTIFGTTAVVFGAALLGGVVMGAGIDLFRLRRTPVRDRLTTIPDAAVMATASRSHRVAFWLFSFLSFVMNPSWHFWLALVLGALLGLGIGRDLVHRLMERRVGTTLFVAVNGVGDRRLYCAVTSRR